MHILYVDEYGEDLYMTEGNLIPMNNDTVVISEEDWRVKSRTFHPTEKTVIIELTQNIVKSKKSTEGDDRLNKMQQSIMQLGKRQDSQDKKSRLLREQLVSVRTYLRAQTRTPKT